MVAPTKTWRRWHRKINVNQRRFAVSSALAASAIPALVMARGHRVDEIAEVPLVVDNKSIDNIDKTKKVKELLESLKAYDDVEHADKSTQIRSGVGKMRNRRYVQRRGPLVVYNEKTPVIKALRNLPGVETASVSRLNLLQLAPGGHLGRFIIWTKDAFEKLDSVFGTYKRASTDKIDYKLPRPLLTNADLTRIINSDEVQSVLKDKVSQRTQHTRKKNPLKNLGALIKLNPYAKTLKRRELLAKEQRDKKKAAIVEAKRKGTAPVVDKKEVEKKKQQKAKHTRIAKANAGFKNILFKKL